MKTHIQLTTLSFRGGCDRQDQCLLCIDSYDFVEMDGQVYACEFGSDSRFKIKESLSEIALKLESAEVN